MRPAPKKLRAPLGSRKGFAGLAVDEFEAEGCGALAEATEDAVALLGVIGVGAGIGYTRRPCSAR